MTNPIKSARVQFGVALAAATFSLGALPAVAQDYIARIGHLESEQQSRHIHLAKVAELVSERTDGAVEFQIFPQGQMGNQRQMTEGVQLGTLEGTVSPAAFLGGFNPVVSVLDIPYLLPDDAEEAQALREGPFGQALLDSFDSRGIVGLALWPNGKKNFTSNAPLDNIAEFADQKFRVMDSRILIEQFSQLGASAIALPFGELYTSLQTGVIDGQENPLDTILRMKFYEVQDYLVVSDHGAMEDVVLFNPMWWESLPEEYRTVIEEAFAEVVPELTAHKAAAVADALAEIEATGETNVRIADEAERAALREKLYEPTKAAYIEMAGEEGANLIAIYEEQMAE
ncbi:TRAP transporter substrate-binding protein [Oceanibium sediminis]|uniref:TRAP transporter substrate-binding protein n=1 Tax=Oceanibium sediminis TaxID=2026339 RepID=UPI000DD2EA96|nr:TRAP transporter substrate-binding protein [Oceanibium sediminis]